MEDSFAYSKDKLDKSNATPDFQEGDLVLLSTTNFNKFKACRKLKKFVSGCFFIEALNEANSVEVELSEELSNHKPVFPVLKGQKICTKKVGEYLLRYSGPSCRDEWFTEKDITEATKPLMRGLEVLSYTQNTQKYLLIYNQTIILWF
ncbi:hypothetical protein O181_008373 [Austropuccinia psidii MF-1]|uniref:Uncharacterized protein n=1 Tax=Austropuccinia psidii MF-1 TaxID=1389203 RepID=A0A9Q3BP95_9BASI|nr:hypothetical protein [Austropuccinia psidii MF-1]